MNMMAEFKAALSYRCRWTTYWFHYHFYKPLQNSCRIILYTCTWKCVYAVRLLQCETWYLQLLTINSYQMDEGSL